jgi:hypothetical protein
MPSFHHHGRASEHASDGCPAHDGEDTIPVTAKAL